MANLNGHRLNVKIENEISRIVRLRERADAEARANAEAKAARPGAGACECHGTAHCPAQSRSVPNVRR